MAEADLLIERSGAVMSLILNRPQKANALTLEMQLQLASALKDAALDEQVKAVVLTASGTKVFSAGADVSTNSDPDYVERRARQMFECCLEIIAFPKPIVAAVNGHACGSGCLFALLCDSCIAVEEAMFSLPEILGGRPTFAGISLLGRLCGDVVARNLVLSGRRMPAAESVQRGLAAALCPPDKLGERAIEMALGLARHAPLAYAQNKAWLYRDYRVLLEDAAAASKAARATKP